MEHKLIFSAVLGEILDIFLGVVFRVSTDRSSDASSAIYSPSDPGIVTSSLS